MNVDLVEGQCKHSLRGTTAVMVYSPVEYCPDTFFASMVGQELEILRHGRRL